MTKVTRLMGTARTTVCRVRDRSDAERTPQYKSQLERMPELLRQVVEAAKKQPRTTISALVCKFNTSRPTMTKLAKQDFGDEVLQEAAGSQDLGWCKSVPLPKGQSAPQQDQAWSGWEGACLHRREIFHRDYSIWDRVVGVACREEAPNITLLKRHVVRAWHQLDTDCIQTVCSAFHRHLEEVVAVEGGRIERQRKYTYLTIAYIFILLRRSPKRHQFCATVKNKILSALERFFIVCNGVENHKKLHFISVSIIILPVCSLQLSLLFHIASAIPGQLVWIM